ncbi:sulfotransferase family 2 domain-containing protein [Gilvimarinus sp. 1_MG-2023]|uniref:sulfotransferase family 2 domain-containing protein n=1 Tax=Gilvimarinus sp. 1_MG-2023 TaxID=3062638 RepID=UPI0026E29384|nr:sulfotransferase family 2 domain-containing protein [Gilvimarinus sp. 1_MG-2023]MDO6745689.1 sulfotransferase family 2 domain-containing protein [Gilvimarinus sp. 1_MG-2023]
MISNKYKCIFVHIPKVAGQSIEHFFLNHHNLSWEERATMLLRYNSDPKKGPERLAHLTASEYVDCSYLSEAEFNNYYKFSFVRNPWARIVSEFNYRNYHKSMSFREFVTTGLPDKSNYSDVFRHLMPQYDFLHDDKGNLLVDFVGRFENLQADFDYVAAQLGFNETLLPHINSSNKLSLIKKFNIFKRNKNRKGRCYSEYYDEVSRNIVDKMYAKDIEAFGYNFGE